ACAMFFALGPASWVERHARLQPRTSPGKRRKRKNGETEARNWPAGAPTPSRPQPSEGSMLTAVPERCNALPAEATGGGTQGRKTKGGAKARAKARKAAGANGRNGAAMASEDRKDGHVRLLPLSEIMPSPENDKLYKPVDPKDPAVLELAESIRTAGFQGAIVVSLDDYILSGHRRRVAARLAGLWELPCVVENIRRLDDDGDVNPEFVRRLEMYNRQREKTLDEKLREAVVKADPEDAYAALSEHREACAKLRLDDAIEITGAKRRKRISEAK